MKARLPWLIVVAMGFAALVCSQIWPAEAPASAAPLLYFVADTESELTRLPVAFTRLTDAEEVKIGKEIAAGYMGYGSPDRRTQTVDEVQAVTAYVQRVGARLALHAHRKLPYQFHFVADVNFINAFALPGGQVFVGGGLMDLMETEDELTFVLGHEIEHIDHFHCAERVQIEMALRRIPLGGVVAIPAEIFVVGYGKRQELEADREGAGLAVDAGYSPEGGVRMLEAFQRLYEKYTKESAKAASDPGDEMARVAADALEGYFRSHPLPAERLAEIRRTIHAERWDTGASRLQPLSVQYVFVTQRARTALYNGRYDDAFQLASHAVELQPAFGGALQTLGRAQFAQADFHKAATTLRKLLDLDPTGAESADEYAIALSASGDENKAVEDFAAWINATPRLEANALARARIDLAGLYLMAGDNRPATAALAEAQKASGAEGAYSLSDLGYWYYRAADYRGAEQLLRDAVERLPQDAILRARLGWALVEQQKLGSALQWFGSAGREDRTSNMGEAVAYWQSYQKELAMKRFDSTVSAQPMWLNPRWVRAQYGPVVAQSIAEMQAEKVTRR